MALRSVGLPPEIPGKLWLSSMPGRFESWSAFQVEAQSSRLSRVVCLTPRSELAALSPAYHAAVEQGTVPFHWSCVPMPNFGVPGDPIGFRREVAQIAQALRDGESVLLHCAAGIGRTGSTAACVLKALGVSTQEALQRTFDAGSNPENAQQSGLVEWF